MPDDLKSRRTERIFRRGHRRVNAVARHQSHVVEFAGITVVAGEMNSRAQPDFVAQLEASATEDRDSDIAAGRQHSSALLGGSLDPDIQPIAISFALGLAKQMSLDRNARTFHRRGHAVGPGRRVEYVRNGYCRGQCKSTYAAARPSVRRAARNAPSANAPSANASDNGIAL